MSQEHRIRQQIAETCISIGAEHLGQAEAIITDKLANIDDLPTVDKIKLYRLRADISHLRYLQTKLESKVAILKLLGLYDPPTSS